MTMQVDMSKKLDGSRAMQAVVDAAVELGDAIETHALEIKNDVDPTSKSGAAKIAKFVLGAANRLPADAAEKFEGYAYLFLGVTQGAAPGIVMFDTKVLEDKIRRYFDPDSPPRWDVHWVPVGTAGRGVCVISVAPPAEGDPMQICHSEFQGDDKSLSMEDGRVYYREKASTRVARSGEIKALQRRANLALPPVELLIEVVAGPPRRYLDSDVRQRFDAMWKSGSARIKDGWWESEEALHARLAQVEERARQEWRDNLSTLAGAVWPGTQFTIANTAGTWLEDIELILHFPQGVSGIQKTNHVGVDLTTLVPTLFEKPKPNDPYGPVSAIDLNWRPQSPLSSSPYPLTWGNDDEGLVVTISGIDLRPDTSWTNDDDDLVIIADEAMETIPVEWQLTREHHRSYKGTLDLPTQSASSRDDLADLIALHHQ
ncbi:hypothetical protein ACIBJI_41970 [Nocardia sp. NPDC050408]|uniref:hypothetical protein n=1 Tax=Nocardia sp. NPDC050408 TaxID=3364319 RepID=UPI00379B542C